LLVSIVVWGVDYWRVRSTTSLINWLGWIR